MKKATGFAIEASKTGLTITNQATGAQLVMNVEKGTLVADKSGLPAGKDKQYGAYLAKFIKDYTTVHTSKSLAWTKRFEKIFKPLGDKLEEITNFRQLSNTVRRVSGEGLVDPKTGNTYFYEGQKWYYVTEEPTETAE